MVLIVFSVPNDIGHNYVSVHTGSCSENRDTTSVVTKYEIGHILLDIVLHTYSYKSRDKHTAVHIPYFSYQKHVHGTIQVVLRCIWSSATATAAVQLTHTRYWYAFSSVLAVSILWRTAFVDRRRFRSTHTMHGPEKSPILRAFVGPSSENRKMHCRSQPRISNVVQRLQDLPYHTGDSITHPLEANFRADFLPDRQGGGRGTQKDRGGFANI